METYLPNDITDTIDLAVKLSEKGDGDKSLYRKSGLPV